LEELRAATDSDILAVARIPAESLEGLRANLEKLMAPRRAILEQDGEGAFNPENRRPEKP
jgi:hypothetical protein